MGNQFRHLIIVEDNAEVREGFTLLIDSSERYQVINSYSNCEDALANLKQDQPDVALMDIDLPGMNGIQGTAEIKRRSPDTEIIMITVMDNYKSVFEALKSGASGYLTKNANASEILRAIDQVMDGGSPMSTKIARMVVQSFQKNLDSPLSDRETEVLGQMAAGKSYSHVADALNISRETVRSHIKNIYTKLQVNSKSDAIARAKRDKLI